MHSKRINFGVILLANFFAVECTVYFIDPYLSKMVELHSSSQPCRIHHDRRTVENVLNKVDSRHVQRVNAQLLNDLSISCKNGNQFNRTGGFTFPGTKWCGPGSIANRYEDLGIYSVEDRCCREHDHCPNQLEPGQCRHGICNISPFTRSHCDCDETFRKCLRNANSDVSNVIGTLYFNVAQKVCFKERRFCPSGMRDNLSYSWFCEEWKFMPFDYFTPSFIERTDHNANANEIPNKPRVKSLGGSKINADLERIFEKDEDVAKIMNKHKV